MVTVEEFLEKFELVKGDLLINSVTGSRLAVNDNNLDAVNKPGHFPKDIHVRTPLAWRENTGKMPCDDGLFIDVMFQNGAMHSGVEVFDWFIHPELKSLSDITHWRPSIKNWIGGSEMLVTRKELDEALDELEKEEVMENQIEKAIREDENNPTLTEARYDIESIKKPARLHMLPSFAYPDTAEGKRELAAQLLAEAERMDLLRIHDFAKKVTQEMLDAGFIDEDDFDDTYQSHVDFYKTLELF